MPIVHLALKLGVTLGASTTKCASSFSVLKTIMRDRRQSQEGKLRPRNALYHQTNWQNNCNTMEDTPTHTENFTKAILKASDELKNRNTYSDHQHLENDITTPEVSSAIQSLKLGKASGPDGIHDEFIKNCGTKLVYCFFSFFYLPCLPSIGEKANCIAIFWTERPHSLESCHFRSV